MIPSCADAPTGLAAAPQCSARAAYAAAHLSEHHFFNGQGRRKIPRVETRGIFLSCINRKIENTRFAVFPPRSSQNRHPGAKRERFYLSAEPPVPLSACRQYKKTAKRYSSYAVVTSLCNDKKHQTNSMILTVSPPVMICGIPLLVFAT